MVLYTRHVTAHHPYPRSQAVSHSVLLTAYVTFEPPWEAGEGLV